MRVCIVGTSRCGTTLLRKILHSHPSLALFNETHWIPKMYEFYGSQRVPWQNLFDIARKTTWNSGRSLLKVNAEVANYDNHENMIRDFTDALNKRGAVNIQEFSQILACTLFGAQTSWGDKTPDYGFYMETIHRLWPECRFVHIVRNGLATARSMSLHNGCRRMVSNGYDNWCSLSYDHIYEKYMAKPMPIESYVATWRRRLQRIRNEAQRLKNGTYMEVRYEALLREPNICVLKIAQFLDLDYPENWLKKSVMQVVPGAKNILEIDLLFNLPGIDLVQINECDESGYFILPFDAGHRPVSQLLDEVSNMLKNDYNARVRGILSVLATNECQRDKDLSVKACALRAKIALDSN